MRPSWRGVAAIALASTGLVSCAGGGSSDGYRVTAYFDKAVSLYRQSSVKVLGLPAGRVTSIKVVGEKVEVRLRLNEDVPIPRDVRAMIVPLSLIGERYVQLFPAWTHGQPRARDGAVIPLERTSIPVEPDEALAAIKELFDTLDPNATGRLVKNLGEDLGGTGPDLNGALKGLGELTAAVADRDDQLLGIIDHFDRLSATLRTREVALGKVMDGFAQATGLLAEERRTIESLVKNLASVATTGLDLTSEHAAKLDRDLSILTRLLQSVNVNIDGVRNLLDSAPLLVAGPDLDGTRGLAGAWDPDFHHLDLRNSASPTVAQLFEALGIPVNVVCVPIDVQCVPQTTSTSAAAGPASVGAEPMGGPAVEEPAPPTGWVNRLARSLAEVFS